MKTVAEIIDMVEAYGIAQRFVHGDNHGLLADIERAIKEREAGIVQAARRLVAMCDAVGDFRNGVADPTGTIDEGMVIASEILAETRAAIIQMEQP